MLSFNRIKDLKRSFWQQVREKFSTVDQQEGANPTQCLQTLYAIWDIPRLVAYSCVTPLKNYESLYLKAKNCTRKSGRASSGQNERCSGLLRQGLDCGCLTSTEMMMFYGIRD